MTSASRPIANRRRNEWAVEGFYEHGYYEADLIRVFDNDCIVRFKRPSFSTRRLPKSSVRYPSVVPENLQYDINMSCEVQILDKEEDNFYVGWFECVIVSNDSKGIQVSFQLGDYPVKKSAKMSELRPLNISPSIDKLIFLEHLIPIPENLSEYLRSKDIYYTIRKTLKSSLIYYRPDKKSLAFVTRCRRSHSKALVFNKECIRILLDKQEMEKKSSKLQRQTAIVQGGGVLEEVGVTKNLMGLAMGANKSALREAQEVDGVGFISCLTKSSSFLIHGETKEAVQKARDMLAITQKYFLVPQYMLGRVLGKGSTNITAIVAKSGLKMVTYPTPEEQVELGIRRLDGCVPIVLTGSLESIKIAKSQFQYIIYNIKDSFNLRDKLSVLTTRVAETIATNPTIQYLLRNGEEELQETDSQSSASSNSSDDSSPAPPQIIVVEAMVHNEPQQGNGSQQPLTQQQPSIQDQQNIIIPDAMEQSAIDQNSGCKPKIIKSALTETPSVPQTKIEDNQIEEVLDNLQVEFFKTLSIQQGQRKVNVKSDFEAQFLRMLSLKEQNILASTKTDNAITNLESIVANMFRSPRQLKKIDKSKKCERVVSFADVTDNGQFIGARPIPSLPRCITGPTQMPKYEEYGQRTEEDNISSLQSPLQNMVAQGQHVDLRSRQSSPYAMVPQGQHMNARSRQSPPYTMAPQGQYMDPRSQPSPAHNMAEQAIYMDTSSHGSSMVGLTPYMQGLRANQLPPYNVVPQGPPPCNMVGQPQQMMSQTSQQSPSFNMVQRPTYNTVGQVPQNGAYPSRERDNMWAQELLQNFVQATASRRGITSPTVQLPQVNNDEFEQRRALQNVPNLNQQTPTNGNVQDAYDFWGVPNPAPK